MITSIKEYLKYLILEESKTNKWKSEDLFFEIKSLSIDQRGRLGEHFFRDIFKELNMNVNYIDNKHGDFDIEVNDIKIEIKTATLDVNNKFQHEGIKDSNLWDMVAFLDISQNEIFITFINKKSFSFNNENSTVFINGKTQNIHFRGKDSSNKRATGAGYKVDFKIIDVNKIDTIKDFENLFLKEINIDE